MATEETKPEGLPKSDGQVPPIDPDIHSAALLACAKVVLGPGKRIWSQAEQEAMAELCRYASWLLPQPQRPMTCGVCGGTDIKVEMNVGSDVDEGGEYEQHLDRCSCGATRFWEQGAAGFCVPVTCWGRWSKDRG